MIPQIPSLILDNRTDFDALQFDTIDQNAVPFHVLVARTGFALGPCDADGEAALALRDAPALLNAADLHHEDDPARSVREESDLAPYKPRCDVLVAGAAHAPAGRARRRFTVGLRVQAPDTPAPLPDAPQGLNPMQGPSPAAHAQWQAALALARASVVAGAVLVDKRLGVTGERWLRQRAAPWRLLQAGLRLLTLGAAAPNPWRLTRPQPTLRVPLRYELAQGGECRIGDADAAVPRVPRRERLSAAQRAPYPPGTAPLAAAAFHDNPLGRGFAPAWFLRATRAATQAAPQIEDPALPFTAARFWHGARGKDTLRAAGLGPLGRAWLPRRQLIGTVELKARWGDDEVPTLPADFDFGYWNGAPRDQQCAWPGGGERFTLTNLCPHDAPWARADAQGDTVLRFTLPRLSLFALGADDDGAVALMPLAIDTVIVDTDAGHVDLVWRLCMVADGQFGQVRLLHAASEEQLRQIAAWQADDPAASPIPARPS
ncbi:DUF2169 family type VI secretion system accessory protein [Massilia scottii]|uniref:DUF2169 family type VI secretion system accessory protein n=1 Tax=Massilia scottii TaxID=3057166 RepID=UPI0027968CE7|nr:DUF2169 domain-containing protein [Massilia sp. CCM 9029]MDQ1829737.1 DUF2169 domain-containing protein [Massilia sp. CCM 9029]